ncbi:MAG: hypothetical protein A3K83_01095 [Omnitrophica WOR_2 bacterium RBG_13_44_8b]|nr:MAG: hypothetical protein A3K83_01095 [Omnitrophica WOR_2 bacterium RBG_13_44_8b]
MACRVLGNTFAFLIFLFIPFSSCLPQDEFLAYRGIIHVHSDIQQSQTIYSLQKLVSSAQDKGIKVVVFSDTFLRRLEYRPPGLLKIFKLSFEQESVVKYGIKKYLEDFKKVKDAFPGMVILDGVEVSPYYWWSGNIFRKNLSLNDWNKHLLVVGLKAPGDYGHLPVICNRYLAPRLKDLPILLVIILIVFAGTLFLKKQKKILGTILIIIGTLLLLNNFPFSQSHYNRNSAKGNSVYYQNLINYVVKKGGLVFWAHPEAIEKVLSMGPSRINFYTPSYPESLMLTSGYTGFGVNMLPGTNHDLVLAGQQWDDVLISYCRGRRSRPAWVIGEADYRGSGPLDRVQNIFLLTKFNVDSVYDALRSGRLYARYHSENNIDITLNVFRIQDPQNPQKFAYMGEEIGVRGNPRLFIKGDFKLKPLAGLKIEVIRNGEVIQTFAYGDAGKFDLEFQDNLAGVKDKKLCYRMNIFSDGKLILVTNPIFVEIKT